MRTGRLERWRERGLERCGAAEYERGVCCYRHPEAAGLCCGQCGAILQFFGRNQWMCTSLQQCDGRASQGAPARAKQSNPA